MFESNMMRLSLSDAVDTEYVEIYLHSGVGRQRLTTGAKWAVNQASINQQDVRRTVVPLPPRAEQEAIVEGVQNQLSILDHIQLDIEDKLRSSSALRQSILRHAFIGKLVPQDPHDEPASELLKRIAEERDDRAHEAGSRRQRPIIVTGRQGHRRRRKGTRRVRMDV